MSVSPATVKEPDTEALTTLSLTNNSNNSSLTVGNFELPNHDSMMKDVLNASKEMAIQSALKNNPEEIEKMMMSLDQTDSGPVSRSEFHSDTEEAEEFFERDGKRYKRKITRRVVREKQIFHEIRRSTVSGALEHPPGLLTQSSCPPKSEGNNLSSLSPHMSRAILSECGSSPEMDRSVLPATPSNTPQWSSLNRAVSVEQGPALQLLPDNSQTVQLLSVPRQSTSQELVPMNNYLFQFGQYDNSEPLVTSDFFSRIFQDYQSMIMTFEDLESPNFKTRSVAMAQRFSTMTASGAVINTGTFVSHSRTVKLISGGKSGNMKSLEDSNLSNGSVTFEELPSSPAPSGLPGEFSTENQKISVPVIEIPETPRIIDTDPTAKTFDYSSENEDKTKPSELSTEPLDYKGPWWSPVLEKVDATSYLVFNDCPQQNEVSVKGGFRDALIVYATAAGKTPRDYYLFYQSFLVTYRTFISPDDLIKKLIARYIFFRNEPNNELEDAERAKICTRVLSFLIAVVSQLRTDLSPELESLLQKFATEVTADGNDKLSQKLLETIDAQKSFSPESQQQTYIASSPETKQKSLGLLDINAKVLADQITLLEAEVFNRIELKDLLDIKSIEKYEVNALNDCANHFNKVTLWTRTLIFNAEVVKGASHRDKVMLKLFETLEHLHTLKNFSSYLAMLVAFVNIPDSLISKKLKAKLDRIKSYMTPPSFTEYRQELENSELPCLPYMGLILQHLILLATGNQLFDPPNIQLIKQSEDLKAVNGPIVNYWRCWKHFLIISMFFRREKFSMSKCSYDLRPNAAVMKFLNNFEDHIPKAELDSHYTKISRDNRRSSKKF